jgi:hypothetical protein
MPKERLVQVRDASLGEASRQRAVQIFVRQDCPLSFDAQKACFVVGERGMLGRNLKARGL